MTTSPSARALRLVAAFALAAAGAAIPACAPSRGREVPPGAGSGSAPGEPWAPRMPVFRIDPLAEDPDRDAKKDRYTGSDSCAECHRGRTKSLKASFHAPLLGELSSSTGCEECHGPGIGHVGEGDVSRIRHPDKAAREASNAVCLRCHSAVVDPKRPFRGHPKWVDARKVACASCHEVHQETAVRRAEHALGTFGTAAALEAAGAQPVPPSQCIACHPDYHPEMARSGHADLASEGRACAECHGNGSLHAASGGLRGLILEPTKLEAAEADRSCVACHQTADRPLLRWTCSEHRMEGVACVACHDPNAPLGKTLRQEDPALCIRCHTDVGAEFRLPSRHPIGEGRMGCSDCHDPHGNESGVHRFDLSRRSCNGCHAEKAGPFVFDHTAKDLEGCIVCHRPHGSPNSRLLETRDARTLCLACHPELPRDHEQKAGSVFRECLRCHVEIHGSQTSRSFLR